MDEKMVQRARELAWEALLSEAHFTNPAMRTGIIKVIAVLISTILDRDPDSAPILLERLRNTRHRMAESDPKDPALKILDVYVDQVGKPLTSLTGDGEVVQFPQGSEDEGP